MYNPKLHFHFTGIGGAGMSGIAEILLNLGFQVSGSDLKRGEACLRLERLGAEIRLGHSAENVPLSSSLVVYSSAVRSDNVELEEARHRGIPVIRRAEVLAELMRLKFGVGIAGSHGKTTTTSMVATVLEGGGLDPTVIIGGQLKSSGSGSRLGRGDFLVAETDESDRSFLLLKPTIAVVTNIDSEHLSAYGSLQELERSFEQFVASVPFYGLAVLCVDDPRVRGLAERYRGRKMTYGFSPDAELRAVHIDQKLGVSNFEVLRFGEPLCQVTLPVPGRHLVLNSLASIAVGLECNLSPLAIAQALKNFSGVERRLEVVSNSAGIIIMNDYAHHPAEIRATLRAIRENWGDSINRLHVVFQPHRYSRTRDCFIEFLEAFSDCDRVIVTDIYAASEEPIDGVSSLVLCEALIHACKEYVPELDHVLPQLLPTLESGDMVVCLGAGSIGHLPHRIVEALEPRIAARA